MEYILVGKKIGLKNLVLKKVRWSEKNWVGKFCWLEIFLVGHFFGSERSKPLFCLLDSPYDWVKRMSHTKNKLPRLGAGGGGGGGGQVSPIFFTYFF